MMVEKRLGNIDRDVSAVLALKDDKLVMLRQKRVYLGKEILEIPAGHIDDGETPGEAARRELEEESGYKAGTLEKVLQFHPIPGSSRKAVHLFVARDLQAGEQDLDEDEQLEVVEVAPTEALGGIGTATIDAKSIIALLFARSRGII